jgi:hypothetical protein
MIFPLKCAPSVRSRHSQMKNSRDRLERISEFYIDAKYKLITTGHAPEIDWQYAVSTKAVDVPVFMSEYAWVVLNSGMRESVIAKRFPRILSIFRHFSDLDHIVDNQKHIRNCMCSVFNNQVKLDSIITSAQRLAQMSFRGWWDRLCMSSSPADYLSASLPYMGPATSLHLLKNLGFQVMKPDRHLVRLASMWRFVSAHTLCSSISEMTGDPISVVDIVLWRTAERNWGDIPKRI